MLFFCGYYYFVCFFKFPEEVPGFGFAEISGHYFVEIDSNYTPNHNINDLTTKCSNVGEVLKRHESGLHSETGAPFYFTVK